MVGLFINTLALRVKFGDQITFGDLITCVKRTTLDAFQHAQAPFDKVVERVHATQASSLRTQANQNPLFQIVFIYQNSSTSNNTAQLKLPNVESQLIDVNLPVAKFDMTWELTEQADGSLGGSVNFNTSLFDRTFIERMVAHFDILTKHLIHDPASVISHVPMLTDTELSHALRNWHDKDASEALPAFSGNTVHQLFAMRAHQFADKAAIIHNKNLCTYSQLYQRAQLVANWLMNHQSNNRNIIGISMSRSIDMIAAIFGILMTGSAYGMRETVASCIVCNFVTMFFDIDYFLQCF
jgi:non-ribosomal peptide synthetase component F